MKGRHCCSIPKNSREHFAAAAEFLRQGLVRRRQCLFVADDTPVHLARMSLMSNGLDPAIHEKSGRLSVVSTAATPLKAKAIEAPACTGPGRT